MIKIMLTMRFPAILLTVCMLHTTVTNAGEPSLKKNMVDSNSRGIVVVEKKRDTHKRIALVIGNGAYKDAPLKNPPNDAKAMARALQGAGFDVTVKTDVNKKQMRESIREFGDRLMHGGMGLFYYAGHGMQVKGKNYLIPVGAEIQREDEIPDEAVSANLILSKMETANNGLNLVVLDACRNNPFARSFRSNSTGLGRMDAPSGTLLVYATRPGSTARDGSGENGAFTTRFLEKMKEPGLDLLNLVTVVSRAVEQDTGKAQTPWMEGMPGGTFYFYAPVTVVQSAGLKDDGTRLPLDLEAERATWLTIEKSSDLEDYESFLKDYPKGKFAPAARARLKQLKKQREGKASSTKSTQAPAPSFVEKTKPGKSKPADQSPLSDPLTGMEFVPVKGGCFQMRETFANEAEDEKQAHKECVDSFNMGKYEVTQSQWKKIMGNNPSHFRSCGDDCPVECVSWDDTQAFIRKLNAQSGRSYSLPTEAEWEYAARSGGKSVKFSGSDNVDEVAWYNDNSEDKTHTVGLKKPNKLGLYDMSGNVEEWCQGWYGEYGAERNKISHYNRVLRGGSWQSKPEAVRASSHSFCSPDTGNGPFGLRLVYHTVQ